MIRILVVCVLASSAIAHADPGRYELHRPVEAWFSLPVPSCGIQADAIRKRWPALDIAYTKAGPRVAVNGHEWRFVGTAPTTVGARSVQLTLARHKEPWNGLTVDVQFFRMERGAGAAVLSVTRYDANGKLECGDVAGYSGAFR